MAIAGPNRDRAARLAADISASGGSASSHVLDARDTDAIADLAIDNFFEMKGHVNHANFREKRNLEMAFEKKFPNEYSSKYSLVTFNEDIGYRDAMVRGRAQDKAILNMLADGTLKIDDDLRSNLEKVKTETDNILEDDRIAGSKS